MTSDNSTGYGPRHGRWENLCFDGDENKYEHWEIKFLAYMKLRKLKKVILPNEDILGIMQTIQIMTMIKTNKRSQN